MPSRELSLRPRLKAAADMMNNCQKAADIGCDHGRLSVALIRMGKAKRIIASDISEPSLEKARILAQKCRLSDKIEVCVSDGLSHLKESDNVDAIIIAGMGGELISSILADGEKVARAARQIILQPMGGIEELRKFIAANGYEIFDETLVFDAKRYYQIIGIRNSSKPCSANAANGFLGDYWSLGSMLFTKRDPLLVPFLKRRENMLTKEIERAKKDNYVPQNLTHELSEVKRLLAFTDTDAKE